MSTSDPFGSVSTLETSLGRLRYWRLGALEEAGLCELAALPFSIRVLLEAALRNVDGFTVTQDDVKALAAWSPQTAGAGEIPFLPGRVLLQDFTGVPCVVDLAAMRAAMQRLGGEPARINPLVPCDLVIDHSVQVDWFGTPEAHEKNVAREFERNRERYRFLEWGQKAFDNMRVVPPDVGIVHQVNLEYLAAGVLRGERDGEACAFFDSLVGTDSHTTMINGLGIVGWGVGGIEAEAVMLGQPISMLLPEVVGFELRGELPAGATATDLVLTVTQMLREKGVVGKFVEFYGEGVARLSLADRATIANMAPEYGATMGFFPADEESLRYYRLTGRPDEQVALVRDYLDAQGMLWSADAPVPSYSDTLSLDCGKVTTSLAGPKRPQDRIALEDMREAFRRALVAPPEERGFGLTPEALDRRVPLADGSGELTHGSVVIAAITSCTNTSNPSVMVGAGLLARNAVARGLRSKPWVKTSLAPGSRVVTDYLEKAGLDEALATLGFSTVAYGCTTCIGNSGPLPEPVANAIREGDLVAASVLSGNRNFEGRVNPLVKANYLASPLLVVAYAIAGTVDVDLTKEPLGQDEQGRDVYLKDLWPSPQEISETIASCIDPEMFRAEYQAALEGPEPWRRIEAPGGTLYEFDESSTYIQEPPFFQDMTPEPPPITSIEGARVLVMLGDSVTTDHISPAGAIPVDSPAGQYLISKGVDPKDFNTYGARRGNDRVMTRGTFANIRLRNLLAPGTEGGWTTFLPTGEVMWIYDAAQRYAELGTPLAVLAGKEYGTGSSRDWAAKGTRLLGVRFVLAESFERIHRSNLIGMGVLPLQYRPGEDRESLGLTGREVFHVPLDDDLQPRSTLRLRVEDPERGESREIEVLCRIDTPVEVDYYRHGGILQAVLRKLLR